uniref:Uncharacterized protein n=1 Tax=Knipowitschia caucasica TaxID=637954 RepID=A0AAV2LGC9_KNICA
MDAGVSVRPSSDPPEPGTSQQICHMSHRESLLLPVMKGPPQWHRGDLSLSRANCADPIPLSPLSPALVQLSGQWGWGRRPNTAYSQTDPTPPSPPLPPYTHLSWASPQVQPGHMFNTGSPCSLCLASLSIVCWIQD